jgi:anti-sigma B factor antagonist
LIVTSGKCSGPSRSAQHEQDAQSPLDGAYVIVAPSGEIDAHVAPTFRETLLAAFGQGCRLLAVDLSDVSFLDAAALGAIVGVARELSPASIALIVPDESLARVFAICGLDRVLSIHGSLEGVLAAQPAPSAGRRALYGRDALPG